MNITNLLITIVVSIIAGIFASFIKPFVDWRFENKKSKYEIRRKLINDARDIISSESFSVFTFRYSSIYMRLYQYFSEQVHELVEMSIEDYEIEESKGYVHGLKNKQRVIIMYELSCLAKKWNLEY